MVFIVIPPTDVDVGSPLDEKLMETIKVDLDDLDSRTTQNTTDITTLSTGGGGGGGGSYRSFRYFETPGIWTSPATIAGESLLRITSGTGGGDGGTPAPGWGGVAGQGANGTNTVFGAVTITPLGRTANGANPRGNGDSAGIQTNLFYHFDDVQFGKDFFNIASGGAGGPSLARAGSRGGHNISRNIETSLTASTIYPVNIGQGGSGGGGIAGGGGPGFSAPGGAGGGPTGGAGGASRGAPGFPGGLIPLFVKIPAAGQGGAGGTANAGFPNESGSGGGGGGQNGFVILYFN